MKVKAVCPRCGAESRTFEVRAGAAASSWAPPGSTWAWWIRHRLDGCDLPAEQSDVERLIGPFPLPNQPQLVPAA